jgi:hypothetical protein
MTSPAIAADLNETQPYIEWRAITGVAKPRQ